MKKIAIQGHITRGNDVIKILESLGGVNIQNYKCNSTRLYYYVNDANYIDCHSWECLDKKYKTYTLEEYEQIQKDMEKRTIKIDLITAREWYNQGGELKKVALQAFSEKELKALPSSWEEYCEINPYLEKSKEIFPLVNGNINTFSHDTYLRKEFPGVIPSKERAEQFLILNKLLQIRDYYNNGWEPDWSNQEEEKFVILGERNKLVLYVFGSTMCLFSFKTKELRDEFFKNFKEELEIIKEFL